ncbi:MAG TPA: hypothetical protein VFD08_04980, partial [Clostridia bacterium]|nr:hypothetical protein [Clostridia bacterium]
YFIDYENAWDFTSNLDDFLHEYIQIMIDKKQLKEAFELLAYLFLKLARQGVDDSSGGTDLVADRCQEMWKEIIDKSELSLKKEQFKWFIEHVDSPDTDYMGEYLEEVLLEKFKEEEFHDHKLLYIEKKSQGYRKEELSRYRRRKLGELALRHIEILELKKISGKEIESYCKDNLELSLIREYLVDFYLEKKKYDRAIKLLKEGKKRDADDREVVANYSLKLKDLYKKLGEQDSYRDELWLLVLEYLPGEEELFDELKALYTKKEWIKKRERIFESLSLSSDRARFYAKEGLYERLLACVVKANGLGLLRSYEKDLKDIYPQELLQKYEDTLEDMASYTTNRKYYQEIVLILKRMEAYPGGETRVNKLVNEWRQKYKNRPAMMDELKKLPFIRLDLIDRFPGWN